MGAISSTMICGRKPIPVNLVGYSESGKTTIFYKFKLGFDTPVDTIHTVGYNFEVIKYKSRSFEVMDLGGGHKVQPTWRYDIWDAKETLYLWLDCHDKENLLLLVFANKQDSPNAMSVTEIIDQFELKTLKHPWHVQPCIAIRGEGISEGFEWLYKNLP